MDGVFFRNEFFGFSENALFTAFVCAIVRQFWFSREGGNAQNLIFYRGFEGIDRDNSNH